MSHRLKLLVVTGLFFTLPALSGAQTRSIISNLANPAIGFNALFLEQAAPDLNQPYGPQFQEAEISLISAVDPTWTLTGNITFSPDGVDPEEVYATTDSIPDISLKIGKFRADFGKQGTLHTHAFPFLQAPVVSVNTLGEEGFKDVGVEASWLTPLPWYASLTLGAYGAEEGAPDQPLNFGSPDHANIPVLGRLKNEFDLDDDTTLDLGFSGLAGAGAVTGTGRADGLIHAVLGADLTFRNVPLRQSNQRGWILSAEYLTRGTFREGVFQDESDGWFAFLQYRWSQSWWTGIRAEEAFNASTDVLAQADPSLTGHVRRASANVTWTPSEFSQVRLEYSLAQVDQVADASRPMDHRLMLQFNYVIGFHPPHAY